MVKWIWDMSKLYSQAYPCITIMRVKIKIGIVASIQNLMKLVNKCVKLIDEHFEILI